MKKEADMNLEHGLQENNRLETRSIPSITGEQYDPTDQPEFSEPTYIRSLIERLLEHDPRRKIIEKGLYRLYSHGLFGEELVKEFLMELYRKNCRPNTLRGYNITFYAFIRFLQETGHTRIETVTWEDLCAYVEQEHDRGKKPRSVRTRLNNLWAFMRFLVDRSVIKPDILKRRIRIKIPESLPRAIDPEDIKKLLAVIKETRDRAVILLLLRTGMRIGELLSTRISDINLKEKRIDIYEAQKNRAGRVVYFSEDAERALKRWLGERDPDQEYLFYGKSGNPLSYETMRQMYMTYIEQAELAKKEYTLHSLRHTFASELLNAGMRLECLQPLLGHKSIEVTRIYARLTDNTRREEYFKAMSMIEKGGVHGIYRLDSKLS
jgi:site-specific recombinase XerD